MFKQESVDSDIFFQSNQPNLPDSNINYPNPMAIPTSQSSSPNNSTDTTHKPPNRGRHIACGECRRKRLKCCGTKPVCSLCSKHNSECKYSTRLRKTGPKPGYLRKLEIRVKELEAKLEKFRLLVPGIDDNEPSDDSNNLDEKVLMNSHTLNENKDKIKTGHMPRHGKLDPSFDQKHLISLDVDEPYPSIKIIDDLLKIFFQEMHPYFCFIDYSRFTAPSLFRDTKIYPFFFYAVMTVSASISDKYKMLEDEFYKRHIKYLNRCEANGIGKEMMSLQYVQALSLITMYEHRLCSHARAWVTCGKAIRAAQMNNLHNLDVRGYHSALHPKSTYYKTENKQDDLKEFDSPETEFKIGIHGSSSEVEGRSSYVDPSRIEEARETFWTCYILDQYGSIATGWPACISDADVSTLLSMESSTALYNSIHTSRQRNNEQFGTEINKNTAEEEITNEFFLPDVTAEYSKKPRFCRLEQFVQNPAKYERGIRSFLAFIAASAYILAQCFKLMNTPPRSDDSSIDGYWWSKHKELHLIVKKFTACLPTINSKDPLVNFAVTLHISQKICSASLGRAAYMKACSVGMYSKAVSYEHECLKSSIDMLMGLRQATNLYNVMEHPGPIYCLFTSAKYFLAFYKEKKVTIAKAQAASVAPQSASQEASQAARISYHSAILAQCRSHIDFILAVFKVVKAKVILAQWFYEKLHLDISLADSDHDTTYSAPFDAWVDNELQKNGGNVNDLGTQKDENSNESASNPFESSSGVDMDESLSDFSPNSNFSSNGRETSEFLNTSRLTTSPSIDESSKSSSAFVAANNLPTKDSNTNASAGSLNNTQESANVDEDIVPKDVAKPGPVNVRKVVSSNAPLNNISTQGVPAPAFEASYPVPQMNPANTNNGSINTTSPTTFGLYQHRSSTDEGVSNQAAYYSLAVPSQPQPPVSSTQPSSEYSVKDSQDSKGMAQLVNMNSSPISNFNSYPTNTSNYQFNPVSEAVQNNPYMYPQHIIVQDGVGNISVPFQPVFGHNMAPIVNQVPMQLQVQMQTQAQAQFNNQHMADAAPASCFSNGNKPVLNQQQQQQSGSMQENPYGVRFDHIQADLGEMMPVQQIPQMLPSQPLQQILPLASQPMQLHPQIQQVQQLQQQVGNKSAVFQATNIQDNGPNFGRVMTEFDNMVNYHQRYPEHLAWGSNLNMDGIIDDNNVSMS